METGLEGATTVAPRRGNREMCAPHTRAADLLG